MRLIVQQIYSLPEESELALYSCDLSRNSDWLIVGQGDGSTIQLDPRGDIMHDTVYLQGYGVL